MTVQKDLYVKATIGYLACRVLRMELGYIESVCRLGHMLTRHDIPNKINRGVLDCGGREMPHIWIESDDWLVDVMAHKFNCLLAPVQRVTPPVIVPRTRTARWKGKK
jgi:hypothetical protein